MEKQNNISQTKWAVILCGGRGSRMGESTHDIPKPLLEVHGKPIIWYIFWTLYAHGFRNFILPLGYKGEMVDEYFRRIAAKTDSQVISIDTGLDTSIALRMYQAIKYIPDNIDFFLLNSDTLFEFDINDMYKLHKKTNALITLSSVDVVSSWGLILMKDNKVTGFERQRKIRHLFSNSLKDVEGLVYSGFSWIDKKAINNIDLQTCGIAEGGRGMETSLFQSAIDKDRVAHYSINGLWFPIDTPKDLQIINMMIDDRHSIGHAAKKYKEKLNPPDKYVNK